MFNKNKYKKIEKDLPELPSVQPVQQVPRRFTQQVQQQNFNQARIIGIEECENGEFIYKVVTNYQLNLGDCIIQ